MVKSMRWRLLGWYASLLSLVVAGFATVLYYQIRKARLDEIDAELQAAARVLEGSLRPRGPALVEGPPPRPAFREGSPPDRPPPLRPGDRRPPPPPPLGAPGGPPPHHLEPVLNLPRSLVQRYEDDPASAPFFFVWLKDGEELKSSPLPDGLDRPSRASSPQSVEEQPLVRQQGTVRELFLRGPGNTLILVGRSIHHELKQLEWLRWQLAVTGLSVLGIGLAGGWLLSSRMFRPIAAISSTAARISASNLSQRIAVEEVDSELGKLAAVLNSMFGRLEEGFARQVRFTADASHELRTPLAVIHSHAELALSRPRTPEEYQETLRACVRASRRMKSIVEGLLTLARADSGKLELKCHRFDLAELVRETVALVEPLAEQKTISLEVETQEMVIVADRSRLAQVITNLVTNAIGYNRPGGEVRVSLKSEGQEAVLRVADTGCGIPEEDQPHVFERFFRADKARSRELGGSGLGLAISRSIVEALGGSITFTSELNQGTTFVVRLPMPS